MDSDLVYVFVWSHYSVFNLSRPTLMIFFLILSPVSDLLS